MVMVAYLGKRTKNHSIAYMKRVNNPVCKYASVMLFWNVTGLEHTDNGFGVSDTQGPIILTCVIDPHHFLLLLWSLQVFKISELLSQMLGPASFMTVIETQVPRKAEGILSEIIFYLPVFAGHYTARSNAQAFVN